METNYKSIAEQLKIPLAVDSDQARFQKSQILMIRHACTNFNVENQRYIKTNGKNPLQDPNGKGLITDVALADVDLNEIGIEQSQYVQAQINQIKFHTVFVSPLSRAMRTTSVAFATHPDRQNIQFIVLPHLSDIKNCASSLMNHTPESVAEKLADGISYDFSLFKQFFGDSKDQWEIEVLTDEALKKELRGQDGNTFDVVLKQLSEIFPTNFETLGTIYGRVEIAQNYITQYISDNQIPEESKVGVVSHMAVMKCLYSNGMTEGKFNRQFDAKYTEIAGL